jgi:hypothetical protein
MQIERIPQLNMVALANRIQPIETELLAAKLHRSSVKSRMEKAFSLHSVRAIGSHSRSTAIRQFSDLDLMVVLRKDEVTHGSNVVSSDTIIRRVLGELRGRFVTSDIRRDGLAATIAFGSTKQSLDVVPAVFSRFDKTGMRPVFHIPNGQGGWIETCPQVHDSYFGKAQEASGNKLRRVSQLIKWWKNSRASPIPIGSFYTDMVLSASGICTGVKTHGQCLFEFFGTLSKGKCGALPDPCGISGNIAATDTEAKRQLLLASVQHALTHSRSALLAQQRRDLREANRQWDIVFNGNF